MERLPEQSGQSFEAPIHRDENLEQVVSSIEAALLTHKEATSETLDPFLTTLNEYFHPGSHGLLYTMQGGAYLDDTSGEEVFVRIKDARREQFEIHYVQEDETYRVLEKVVAKHDDEAEYFYYFPPADILTLASKEVTNESLFSERLKKHAYVCEQKLSDFYTYEGRHQRLMLRYLVSEIGDELIQLYKGREVHLQDVPLFHTVEYQDDTITFPAVTRDPEHPRLQESPYGYVVDCAFIEQLDTPLWESGEDLSLTHEEPCVVLADDDHIPRYLVPISYFEDVLVIQEQEASEE